MPKKREPVKGGAPRAMMPQGSRLMRTHDSMVDFLHGRPPSGSILDLFTSELLGLDCLRTLEGELEDHMVYYDDDDDYDDDHFNAHDAAYKNLKPHPRIKQLTNEEADKHAKHLMKEEERRKDKTVKNKRKKLRKKEKKRLEKENAVKDILPEEEKETSHSSKNLMENPVMEGKTRANDFPESGQTPTGTQASRCDEKSYQNNDDKDENLEINKTEDQQQKDFALNNSSASTTKSVAEETPSERPATERKKNETKLLAGSPSKEERPKVVVKLKVKQKTEENLESNEAGTIGPPAEESAQCSRQLAAFGNRFAAVGRYETAVECFTDAIVYDPQESKLFGNRSLCYERLQQYDNALRDADVALSMQPNWIKGLFRKGKALCGLKRYYEASLIYREVLKLDVSSSEASQELKRVQTLHLMEMGFSWAQSSEALKAHATLEQAVEALFVEDVGACRAGADPAPEEDSDGGQWIHLRTSRPRMQRVKESDAQSRTNSRSPTPRPGNLVKKEIFSVWVGSLSPAITYSTLHELFSRAGTVHSIKMLLEQQCVFVNYTSVEDCERAIRSFNGMVVEGSPLSVRYSNKIRFGTSSAAASDPIACLNKYKKECFFWRTVGCTRLDCTFRHFPEHKNVDRDKFTGRSVNM
ncbi:uncharacterized protein AB9W97_017899 isoform 2-T2 [Spinachia spinachia]